METCTLRDEEGEFEVLRGLEDEATCAVLFAVGGGGDPGRHEALLNQLVANGCFVVAPRFERLAGSRPSAEHLRLRARRLQLALGLVPSGMPVVGVGHSIGAAMLLALAGARAWMGPGDPLDLASDDRIDRLALLAPATGFFRAPAALDAVDTPLLVWVGGQDPITPVEQSRFLEQELGGRFPVELRIEEGAGHFSFMDLPPPGTVEPLPDREGFLSEVASRILRFVVGSHTS